MHHFTWRFQNISGGHNPVPPLGQGPSALHIQASGREIINGKCYNSRESPYFRLIFIEHTYWMGFRFRFLTENPMEKPNKNNIIIWELNSIYLKYAQNILIMPQTSLLDYLHINRKLKTVWNAIIIIMWHIFWCANISKKYELLFSKQIIFPWAR